MTVWFFGDSWPGGAELGRFRNPPGHPWSPAPELAYPQLVSDFTGCKIQNHSVVGSTIPMMLEKFQKCDIVAGDVVMFAITARSRLFYKDESGQVQQQQYPRISNIYEDERVCAQICVLLYYMSLARGATPYFFNLFDHARVQETLYKEIPDSAWIISKEETVVSTLYDPEWFSMQPPEDRYFHYWIQTNRPQVKQFIFPCEAHPNLQGQQRIAEFIAKFLPQSLCPSGE